jgi:hypothetical protein
VLKGKVQDFGYFGKDSLYRIRLATGTCSPSTAVNTARMSAEQAVATWEDDVYLSIDPEAAMLFGTGTMSGAAGRWFNRRGWRDVIIASPYLWLVAFFLVPFIIVIVMSFAKTATQSPPFAFLPDWPFIRLDQPTQRLFTRTRSTSAQAPSHRSTTPPSRRCCAC